MGDELPTTILEPTDRWWKLHLRELWQYRELLFFLAWRDVKVRYKQTAFGAAWAVLQPFLTMVVFTVIFGNLAQIPSDGVPYPVFAFSGLLPWQLFAHALGDASNSLVANQQLLTKVYFPRLVIPFSSVVAGTVDFGVAFIVLLALMLFYGMVPTVAILLLPLFVALALGTALAVSLWLSALNVQFRDVRYTIPFLTQLWLYATPIAYPSSLVPERWRMLFGLNPMAGVVEGFRWAVLGQGDPPGPILLVSVLTVLVLGLTGLFFFRRMEQTFADVV